MKSVLDLKVRLFADGTNKATILEQYKNPDINGYTTNPTLMHKAGIKDYEAFARDILETVSDRPVSFEIFADDFNEMERQARKIAGWGKNVYVKIPVMNTKRTPSYRLIRKLSDDGIKLNITAVMTSFQVEESVNALFNRAPSYISVFAGRIADTGRDPIPYMKQALEYISICSNVELIWASPRELLNVFQADEIGCHIITATNDILKKLDLVGKNLYNYSLETVQMFHNDAKSSGYTL